jgi:hypothetical protein
MDEKNKFALVRKPSSAVKKATPRVKRIVSDMAGDALSLAKQKQLLSVLVAGGLEGFVDTIPAIISSQIDKRLTVKTVYCERMTDLSTKLSEHKFDIAFLYLTMFQPPHPDERRFNNTQLTQDKVNSLFLKNEWITLMGLALVNYLRQVHGARVVVLTGSGYIGMETHAKNAGADACFYMPPDLKPFVETLRYIIQKVKHPLRTIK